MNLKRFFIVLILISSVIAYSQEASDISRVDETTLSMDSDQANTNGDAEITGTSLGVTDYLTVILVLVFVIGALYLVLKVIKKVGGDRVGLDNDLIHVISTKALKGTTALHLVEVGNQVFLIGATDSSINSIAEITDKESKDMISLNLSSDNVPQSSFFTNFVDKLNKKNEIDTMEEEATTPINTQKDKLTKF